MRAFAPLFVVVVAMPLLAAPAVLAAPRIEDVKINQREGGVDVVITASEPLTFQSWRKGNAAVVVDLLEAESPVRTLPGLGPVKAVEITRHDVGGTGLTRVSLPLWSTQDYDVKAVDKTIVVAITGVGTAQKLDVHATLRSDILAPVLVASADRGIIEGEMGRATATDAPLYAQASGARTMTYIGFKNSGTQSRVFARMNDAAEFNVRKEGDNLIVLEIKNATIPLRNNKNHLDSTFFDSPVKMITPSEIEDATPTIRITIEMKAAVPFETKVEGREIAIYFKK